MGAPITTSVYSGSADGRVRCQSTVYATARTGGGSLAVIDNQPSHNDGPGQTWVSPNYTCFETMFGFDLSGLPSNAIVTAVTPRITSNSSVEVAPVLEMREYDWGATLDTADFVSGASVGSLPLVASYDTALGWVQDVEYPFVSQAALLTGVQAAVVAGGTYRVMVHSDRFRLGTAPSTSAGSDDEAPGLYYAEAGAPFMPRLEITYYVPSQPMRRIRKGLPRVVANIDGHEVGIKDWSASTIANGGYDRFNAAIGESIARRYPSSFEQEAPVSLVCNDDTEIWAGILDVDPTLDNGIAQLSGSGYKIFAERRKGTLLFMDQDPSKWNPLAGSPHNANTDTATLSVVQDGGAMVFEAKKGEATDGGAVYYAYYMRGSTIRRFACTLQTLGDVSGMNVTLYKATGPSGSLTSVSSLGASGLKDVTITNPLDMVVLGFSCTSSAGRAATGKIIVRDIRVNDKATGDGMTPQGVVKHIGRIAGYEVEGIPGSGITAGPTPEVWTRTWDKPNDMFLPIIQAGNKLNAELLNKYARDTVQLATTGSAMNILPFTWDSGPWSEAMSYMAHIVDMWWGVFGLEGGGQPALYMGPFNGVWDVELSANTKQMLQPQPRYNEVLLRYTNPAGVGGEIIVKADPDPFEKRGRRVQWEENINQYQPNDTTANTIARTLVDRLSSRRYSGVLEVAAAHDLSGHSNPYMIRAGQHVFTSDWGPNEPLLVRIAQVEMSNERVRLGIEQPVSVPGFLALTQARRLRAPLGPLFRVMPFHFGGKVLVPGNV